MNKYNHLVQQLDLIIGFLDVSNEEIFNKIKGHYRENSEITINELYKYDYQNFSNHICSSAFLLGFTHFEDFIAKMTCELLIYNPSDITYKITYKAIKENENNLLAFLAEEQSRQMKLSEKLNYLSSKKIFNLNKDAVQKIKDVTEIRNCMMHNNGLADKRLAGKYTIGAKIILSLDDVNEHGFAVRKIAYEVWNSIEKLKNTNTNPLKENKK